MTFSHSKSFCDPPRATQSCAIIFECAQPLIATKKKVEKMIARIKFLSKTVYRGPTQIIYTLSFEPFKTGPPPPENASVPKSRLVALPI